jgi:hypothetical protein
MSISELLKSIKEKALRHKEGATAAWDAFKGSTGMIPKEEQTIGNLKYAIRMNQEEMEANEINFVDFNGMVLSMTIDEVMQLTEMPKPNEYYNLTFEHWTKSLEEIQDGRCHTVGATYHTTDGCNYYVVEVEAGYTMTIYPEAVGGKIYWGDGTENDSAWQNDHTYENKGRYIIKVETTVSKLGLRGGIRTIKEIYLSENVNRNDGYFTLRGLSELKKISISDNGTAIDFGINGLDKCKLKSLVVSGSYVGGSLENNYATPILPNLTYLVLDSITKMSLPSLNDLKCLSIKNVKTVNGYNGTSYGKLKHIVFDNVETIGSHAFNYGGSANENTRYNRLSVIDFSDTIQSIKNNCFLMGVDTIYMRSITPPTLGGTNVFWGNSWGYKTTIHIRKDATYTDANGDTWTGLEAYAKATNWATLYANTNYTFIDDL